jgi:hypothetical protein
MKTRNSKLKKSRKRKYRGGAEEILLKQITITQPIINAVKERAPDLNLDEYKISKEPHGFRLSRMDSMMDADIDSLLQKEPVEVTQSMNSDGKPKGIKIDGVGKKLYEIVNGRHRVARSIIEQKPTINVNIV